MQFFIIYVIPHLPSCRDRIPIISNSLLYVLHPLGPPISAQTGRPPTILHCFLPFLYKLSTTSLGWESERERDPVKEKESGVLVGASSNIHIYVSR